MPIIYVIRGFFYKENFQYEEALEDFTQALDIYPRYSLALRGCGETYQSMKRYDEALTDFTQAIELDPDYKLAIASRGKTYQSMKRYDEALTDFTRAIELDPDYKLAIANRGLTYRLMERYDEALTDFTRAIELDPDYDWAIAGRGETYLLSKRYYQALTDFNKAMEVYTNDWLYYDKSLTHLALKQLEEFKAALKEAIRLATQDYRKDSGNHQNTFNLALYYLVARKQQKAGQLYKDALSENASIYYIQEAIRDLQELLIVFPTYPYAAEMKGFLESALSLRQVALSAV